MGRTPDRFPGTSDEEELLLEDRTADGDPPDVGGIRRLGDRLRYRGTSAVQQILKAGNVPVDFADVDLSGIQDGDSLAYEAATKKFKPGSGGGGLTPSSHRALDQLVHEVAESSYTDIVYTGSKVTAVVTWTDSGMTKKIREELYTYTGVKVTTIVTKQYDSDGNLAETYTETVTYSGALVDNITGVLS